MTGADRPQVEDRLPENLENRPYPLHRSGLAPDHENQFSVLRTGFGPGYRGVNHRDASGSQPAGGFAGIPGLRG